MRYLMILEVSQKQAYIFSSTKLRENIANSEAICKVTDPGYFKQLAQDGTIVFDDEKNLVYSGGGHTVLEFASEQEAKEFAFEVSKAVKREFHEMELFIKIMQYDSSLTPGENLSLLSAELEKKKALRKASFHQGTFGVEKPDTTLRRPVPEVENAISVEWNAKKEYVPSGFHKIGAFGEIGNQKNESSFIAVVHIDGNAMGKRVENLRSQYDNAGWDEYKKVLKQFSDSVDEDFTASYREMADEIAKAVNNGQLDMLDLINGSFPVRRIILAGDDVCFVTEGRIGIEAARIFIEKLSSKENRQDHKGYTACAGVAIVHQKSPFYKAYELSEMLCTNAKRYLASFQDKIPDAGALGCAIDWHIEYGTGLDDLSEIRKMYDTDDGKHRLELRPYLITADEQMAQCDPYRRYDDFKKRVQLLQREMRTEKLSRGKVKELRTALKEGGEAVKYYMKSNLIDDLPLLEQEGKDIDTGKLFQGKGLDRTVFVDTADGKSRSLLFDAIEIIDAYVGLEVEA